MMGEKVLWERFEGLWCIRCHHGRSRHWAWGATTVTCNQCACVRVVASSGLSLKFREGDYSPWPQVEAEGEG